MDRALQLRARQRRGAVDCRAARLPGGARPPHHGQSGLSGQPAQDLRTGELSAWGHSLRGRSLAVARGAARELLWGLRHVTREMRRWRRLARRIPDPLLRADALAVLERKRCNIEGAAFFWTLARRRDHRLLRLLVAYEVLADYLDRVNERNAHYGIANGRQLHLALTDALSAGRPRRDYYRLQARNDDGGYAHALVDACRILCGQLPCYARVRPLALQAATLTQVLALNHHPDPVRRDLELQRWASRELPAPEELVWFERTAAASAWLTVLALLALAAEPRCAPRDAERVYAAYLPWISLLGTMLDSYADVEEDDRQGEHSYIAHYPSAGVACERLAQLIERACREAGLLPNGARHNVLVACMVGMYLSKASARSERLRLRTEHLIESGDPLIRRLMPVMRAFRACYGQTFC